MNKQKIARELMKIAGELEASNSFAYNARNKLVKKLIKVVNAIDELHWSSIRYEFGDFGSDYPKMVDKEMKQFVAVTEDAIDKIMKALDKVKNTEEK